mgnify:CR=1 FL=1
MLEDTQIVNLFFIRSEEALRETDRKYGHFCFKIAWNILENQEDAEESVSDTYLAAWKSIPPTRPSQLSAFLAKITRHISLDRWRRRSAEKRGGGEADVALEELEECVAGSNTVESTVAAKELQAALNRFLETQSEMERVLFVSRYWYLRPVKEIADKTGLSVSNVKTQLCRTRKKLRFFLEKEELL